jgi:eukaryotic-like serine/threonine-protein kinase
MQQRQLILDDRYELRRQIGEGGFSRAYLARDHRLGRTVVAKILRRELSTDQASLHRFEREAKIAASVSGPNIVDIYDFGMVDGQPVIISQFISGVDLSKVIRRGTGLRADDVIDIMLDVLGGLETLHRSQIQHRDIKPSNILIPKWDAPAKLTDFGISRSPDDPRLTDPGMILGSPMYMSPEQVSGQEITFATDIYSAAVVMYELSTGRPPFVGDSSSQIMMKHLQEPPVPPRQINGEIPKALESVILKGLAKEPFWRFASAREMADALRAARDSVTASGTASYDPDRTRYMPADDEVTVVSNMPEHPEFPSARKAERPSGIVVGDQPAQARVRKRGFQRQPKQIPFRRVERDRPASRRGWFNIRVRSIPRYPVVIMLVLLIAVMLLAAIQGT